MNWKERLIWFLWGKEIILYANHSDCFHVVILKCSFYGDILYYAGEDFNLKDLVEVPNIHILEPKFTFRQFEEMR